MGGTGGLVPPRSKKLAKLSKKNVMKLVGYTFRTKNYINIPLAPHRNDLAMGDKVETIDKNTLKLLVLTILRGLPWRKQRGCTCSIKFSNSTL